MQLRTGQRPYLNPFHARPVQGKKVKNKQTRQDKSDQSKGFKGIHIHTKKNASKKFPRKKVRGEGLKRELSPKESYTLARSCLRFNPNSPVH